MSVLISPSLPAAGLTRSLCAKDEMRPNFEELDKDQDGLPAVFRRIPDTSVKDYLRGLDGLPDEAKQSAIRAATKFAEEFLAATLDPSAFSKPNNLREIRSIGDLGRATRGVRDTPLKTLKQLVEDPTSPHQAEPGLISYVDQFEVVTAGEIRSEVETVVTQRFGLTVNKLGGGVWLYAAPDGALGLNVDYRGSWGQQLRYTFSHRLLDRMSLELMWGAGVGDWNFIHSANLVESVDALCEIYAFFKNLT